MPEIKPHGALELEQPAAAESCAVVGQTFAEIFHTHAGYVLQLLLRLGVREADIEDVAQEVFVVVHDQLPVFEGRSSAKTWVCGITLRKASEYRRKAYRRRERLLPAILDARSCAGDQERQLEQHERADRLQRAMARLPEKQLQVFVLFEIEELSMAEVARAVGCPRFTAYTRLHAARRSMRAFLARAYPQERSR